MEPTSLIKDIITISASLESLSIFAAAVIGYIGVTIMAYGAVKSAMHFTLSAIRQNNHLPFIRIDLGKHLALGLEFLVGKDIIESIIRPSWDDLGKLATIIAIRIVITLMLSYELKEIKEEIAQDREYLKMSGAEKKKKR
ncbi:MAG: DUF1622 domain-containing protein [Candidatus Peribacteraceae bacterium]|jgi:uncharacterized membrane protein|nr:DUF1622 domain-containing protein [Candidatus Peribacteraceae bacterium]|tara:strand:- start:109 stop:528 length:420 start_codon:yes stop_codon:yes gene_type:complete